MENQMKKFSLILVFIMAVSLAAQEKTAKDKAVEKNFIKSTKITVNQTSISLEKYGQQKEENTFKAGETVFINLELKGLQANEQKQVVVQADLSIPQLNLDSKNLIDGSTDYDAVIPMYFEIPIESVERGGSCNAKITIRDMVAKTFVEFNTTFKLSK
jgi:hypothetical protein